jgi:hypothetical protein
VHVTARVIVQCDAVHPERTPPECRAFLVTRTAIVVLAYGEAQAAGWTETDDGELCPSCSRAAT